MLGLAFVADGETPVWAKCVNGTPTMSEDRQQVAACRKREEDGHG